MNKETQIRYFEAFRQIPWHVPSKLSKILAKVDSLDSVIENNVSLDAIANMALAMKEVDSIITKMEGYVNAN